MLIACAGLANGIIRRGLLDLERHPGVAEIGLEHERMHQYAGTLLRSSVDGVPISIGDYERFVSAMKRLRLEVHWSEPPICSMQSYRSYSCTKS